jgi:hypothetical protein
MFSHIIESAIASSVPLAIAVSVLVTIGTKATPSRLNRKVTFPEPSRPISRYTHSLTRKSAGILAGVEPKVVYLVQRFVVTTKRLVVNSNDSQ